MLAETGDDLSDGGRLVKARNDNRDARIGRTQLAHHALIIASAARAAVSAFKICGPSETAVHLWDAEAARSRAVQPPSGPVNSAMESGAFNFVRMGGAS